MYVIWDPGSHEHLAYYDYKNPAGSNWVFLDSDTYNADEVHTFKTENAAKRAAKRILSSGGAECQLDVHEVEPVLMTLGSVGRVDE